jgi:DNA-binding transcriptional regulator YhcF (GntR family)
MEPTLKVIDKIRNYINEQKNAGLLDAGDKLPPYRELTAMFKGSIQTVRSALAKLEIEGLVESVNGVGCFVNGKHPLSVAVTGFPKTTISHDKLQQLLDRYIKQSGLHIKVKVIPLTETSVEAVKNYPAVLDLGKHLFDRTLVDFNEFSDYADVIAELQDFPCDMFGSSIPFFYFTHHIGVHRQTLKTIGMQAENITADFSWWSHYVSSCKQHNIVPASIYWPDDKYGMFRFIDNLFFSLKINIDHLDGYIASMFKLPMFDGSAGRQLLQIINDCPFSEDAETSFFTKQEGMDFKIGSWINIFNERRDKELVDKIDIVAYRHGNKKIHTISARQLQLHLLPSVNVDEKERLWALVKLMISKDFQKEFCALSGALSVRNDFLAEDYFWSNNVNMKEMFLPSSEDIILYEDIFPLPYITVLTTMIELFKQKQLSADAALAMMDKKFMI